MKKILLPFLLVLLAACSDSPADDRPTLTVSVEPLRYVVEAIAGENYQVHTLMPQGGSPETYEPTPRQMMELSASDAVFRVGTLGFEKTMLTQMVQSTQDLPVYNLDRGIKGLVDPHHKHDGMESMDPHVWMSPANLQLMAENACDALCTLDSLHADGYRQRLDSFKVRLDSLDAELKRCLQPVAQRAFLIYHPALGYYAHQYGLFQLSVEHDGKEPSAAYLEHLINKCKAEDVRIVFISKEHSGRAAHRIADALSARIVTINPLDYDIPAQLRHIAKALKNE